MARFAVAEVQLVHQLEARAGVEDTAVIYTAHFANGTTAEVKCCAPDFSDGDDNYSWCEAVLFNDKGHQIAVSEPEGDFFGEWEFNLDGDVYYVDVEEKVPVM